MSDQKTNHGHHAITREAVRQFFASGRGEVGDDGVRRIDGMDEVAYFHALDKAQEDQDISVGPLPSYGTSVPAAWDGDAQRQHAMADPKHDGAWNVDADRRYVEDQMADAYGSGGAEEMRHLGNATHSLEDSYSEAHMFRGDAANAGDPHAPIDSINVWQPQPHLVHGVPKGKFIPGSDTQGTHDERFDTVPVEGDPDLDQRFDSAVPLVHGTDRASAQATAELLEQHYDNKQTGASRDAAAANMHGTVGQFYQQNADGTAVNRDEGDPAWIAERDRRLAEHGTEEARYGQEVIDPNAPNASYQPEPAPEPDASYDPSLFGPQASEQNASYDPSQVGPNASYAPPPAEEPDASYDPGQSYSQPEPNASYDPGQSTSQ